MISENIKRSLRRNWGPKAEALDCYAEVKFIDPLSDWKCYVYAMSPHDDEIECLLYSPMNGVQVANWSLRDLYSMYNHEGDSPEIDHEYRKTRAVELLKQMSA